MQRNQLLIGLVPAKMFNFVFLVVLSVLSGKNVKANVEGELFYTNQDLIGSVIEYRGTVLMSQNTVAVKVDMEILRTFPKEIELLQSQLVSFIKSARAREVMSSSQLVVASEIVHMMNRYLPKDSSTRKKRSLMPIVGSVLHGLFGVSTDGDISGINKKLEKFENWAHAQGGLLKKSLEVINRHSELLEHLRNKFSEALESLSIRSSRVEETVLIGNRLNALFTSCSLLVSDFRSLVDGLSLASKGVVSQSLLPSGELVSILEEAQAKFNFVSLFKESNVDWYYPLLKADIVGHTVFISIPFSSSRQFTGYKIIPFPSLLDGVQVRLKGKERLIVVSNDLELIAFPRENEFNDECFTNSRLLHVCPPSVLRLSPSHVFECERDIVTKGRMGKSCEFERVNVTNIELEHTNGYFHVFFPSPTTINLNCINRTAEVHEVLGAYVIKDACGLSSPLVKLFPASRGVLSYNISYEHVIFRKLSNSQESEVKSILRDVQAEQIPGEIKDEWQLDWFHPVWQASGSVMGTIVLPTFLLVLVVIFIVVLRRHGQTLSSHVLKKVQRIRVGNATGPTERGSGEEEVYSQIVA